MTQRPNRQEADLELVADLAQLMSDAALTGLEMRTPHGHVRLRSRSQHVEPIICAPCTGQFHARHPLKQRPEVHPGAFVRVDQTVGFVGVDGSLRAVQAPRAGRIVELLVADGSEVNSGQAIMRLA